MSMQEGGIFIVFVHNGFMTQFRQACVWMSQAITLNLIKKITVHKQVQDCQVA